MDVGFEAHLSVGSVTVDADDIALLRAVDDAGSLNAAADALGRSYSRVQKRVAALEGELGPLVERRRGGPDGGGSRLTDHARELLVRYVRLRAALADTAGTSELVIAGTVTDTDGELATVDTSLGPVRAIAFDDATDVHVTIRADAVTLHAPDSAPPDGGTSARNRFEGTVDGVDGRESVATVWIAVADDVSLPVLVTRDSLARLDLAVGEAVVATFKATATRATPAPERLRSD